MRQNVKKTETKIESLRVFLENDHFLINPKVLDKFPVKFSSLSDMLDAMIL